MNLSIMKKIAAVGAALTLTVSALTGCGLAGSGGSADAEEIAGKQETWGNLTVFVPEDMYLTGGSVTEPEDPDTLWIQENNDQFKYFIVSVVDAEQLEGDIKMSVEINDGETPEPFELNGTTWHGMTYTFNEKPGFQVGAEIDGVTYEVSSFSYALDDAHTTAILKSIGAAS